MSQVTIMTDELAKEILNKTQDPVPDWNDEAANALWHLRLPEAKVPVILLEGEYTVEELQAMIHFYPKE